MFGAVLVAAAAAVDSCGGGGGVGSLAVVLCFGHETVVFHNIAPDTNVCMMHSKTDNDVLVDFYAPWCHNSKRLGPIYGALAAKVEGREKLVIADIDVTANDLDYPGVSFVQRWRHR